VSISGNTPIRVFRGSGGGALLLGITSDKSDKSGSRKGDWEKHIWKDGASKTGRYEKE